MSCTGNAAEHCCWVSGARCPHSIDNHTDETGTFRRWACGLRAKYGNWDDVIESPEYKRDVEPVFGPIGMNCRDWPEKPEHVKCKLCGAGK